MTDSDKLRLYEATKTIFTIATNGNTLDSFYADAKMMGIDAGKLLDGVIEKMGDHLAQTYKTANDSLKKEIANTDSETLERLRKNARDLGIM